MNINLSCDIFLVIRKVDKCITRNKLFYELQHRLPNLVDYFHFC